MTNDRAADSRYPLHELLAQRSSPRSYSDRAVAREDLGALFEAARWAPSCFNDQPWSYVVGVRGATDDGGAWEKVRDTLVPANRVWAERAPVLAISVARLAFARNGKPNRHALHDTGAASMSIALQAEALGLVVHQMGGFDIEAARKSFGIGAGFEPVAAIAIGYAAAAEALPPELAERERAPRERRALEATFFGGRFGEAHPLARE